MTLFSRPPADGPRRRLVLAAVATLLVAVLVAVVVALALRDDEAAASADGGSGAAPSSSATLTPAAPPELAPAPVTPEPAGPTEDASELPASLAPVGFDQQAAVGDGIVADVVTMESIDGTAVGPGNIAGPALRVTIRITNGTTGPVSLDGVAVDLAHGEEQLPASPLDDPSVVLFSGSLQPSESREGVYVFTVPADDRELLTLSVGYQAGAPFMVFIGSGA
jgi:hypothetical protein